MKTAAVSDLKAHLSDYLKQVKTGGEILITDRGVPVARLAPYAPAKRTREALAKMEKEGLITLGPGKLPEDFWEMPRPEDSEGKVRKALIEERENGR